MRIAAGVEMLEVSLTVMGSPNVICPTLLWDKEEVILVDAGYPGPVAWAALKEKMGEAGASADKLRRVILTHQDVDHIGGLPEILQEITPQRVEVLAHAEEKPYIQGDKKWIKMTPQVIASMDSWPEERRMVFKRMLENPPKAQVDKTVADGEELPYAGGITVIHTPGHTPGHICLYLQQSKTLIAGDALVIREGKLLGPVPEHSYNIEEARKSLAKFTLFDIEQVICYHGGVYKQEVNRRIAELARG